MGFLIALIRSVSWANSLSICLNLLKELFVCSKHRKNTYYFDAKKMPIKKSEDRREYCSNEAPTKNYSSSWKFFSKDLLLKPFSQPIIIFSPFLWKDLQGENHHYRILFYSRKFIFITYLNNFRNLISFISHFVVCYSVSSFLFQKFFKII